MYLNKYTKIQQFFEKNPSIKCEELDTLRDVLQCTFLLDGKTMSDLLQASLLKLIQKNFTDGVDILEEAHTIK